MPKARAPVDLDRYLRLKAEGRSNRQIAQAFGIPESTLRDNLKVQQHSQTHEGGPRVDLRDTLKLPGATNGRPEVYLSAQDHADLQAVLAWWRDRARLLEEAQTPERTLVRQTYHIEQRWIEAVRRESDLTGESYAAVVNRAFARYFQGKST